MIDVLELLNRLNITTIKKNDRRWACCPSPNHHDTEPSWYIWDNQNVKHHASHKCFGCGMHGGPTSLVQEVFGLNRSDANAWLKDASDVPMLGAELEVIDITKRRKRFIATPDCIEFKPLSKWTTSARKYAVDRGLTEALIDRWGIGVASTGSLAGRIWIPIRDYEGRLRSWQARSYLDHSIRYMTPSNSRPGTLMGEWLWPDINENGKRPGVVVVIEGPMDALMVDAATQLPVAGLLGNQPSPLHLDKLATFETVIVMTDGDKGGDTAAEALDNQLRRWTRSFRIRPPEGYDPAQAGLNWIGEMLGVNLNKSIC